MSPLWLRHVNSVLSAFTWRPMPQAACSRLCSLDYGFFFQAAVVSILLYECTTWTLAKRMEKKLNGNCTRILKPVLNKSRRQHLTKQQLYSHLPPISKNIRIRRTRHMGYCWRSKDELISDVHLWAPSHGRPRVGWQGRTYLQHLCTDIGCSMDDLSGAMNDRDK